MEDRLIFHIDVNSAFVSWSAVEMLKNGGPDLRVVPSIVGGDPSSRRSIVAAKSIPAKKYGNMFFYLFKQKRYFSTLESIFL